MQQCCAECFGDRFLRRSIIPVRSHAIGLCPYCLTAETYLVGPSSLAEYFQLLAGAYYPDPSGELLVQWFMRDWGLFDHGRMDVSRSKELLAEILDDGEIVRQRFSPINMDGKAALGEWDKLREELRHNNRFFPNVEVDLDRLKDLLPHLTLYSDELPNRWYRARIQPDGELIGKGTMGSPPKNRATAGRANPAGIPYLYAASSRKTAVCEIRPHPGQIICVIDVTFPPETKLVDLRRPRKTVSPFVLEDFQSIGQMRCDLPFLEKLGEQLTMPVLPEAAAIDYTPSQYLCEFIKKCGYGGVVYRSSVSDGINIALFDPGLVELGSIQQYSVTKVDCETEEVT